MGCNDSHRRRGGAGKIILKECFLYTGTLVQANWISALKLANICISNCNSVRSNKQQQQQQQQQQ
jgi:hypothetical protein